jgi:glycosyltransferase involved in cell wall biosynthesis
MVVDHGTIACQSCETSLSDIALNPVPDDGCQVKVAFITPDYVDKQPGRRPSRIGGAGYYRCQLPADMLNKHSDIHAEVFAGAWSDPKTGQLYPALFQDPHNLDRLICDDTGWDVIVLQRWMAEKDRTRILRARAYGQTVVNDCDDHFWALHKHNLAHKSTRADWNPELYKANLAASDHITVSTPHLAEYLTNLGIPVTVLPNMIDLTQWNRQPVRDKVETVGWCGHTGFRSGDLETVGNAMRYFLRDHPAITFVHGGYDPSSKPASELLNLPKHRCATRPACPIEQWPNIWQGLDMAILPLNAVDFNRAKSDIKAKEASASGVPFIATHFGPYVDYGQGLTVGDKHDDPLSWRDALEMTLDHNIRQSLADDAFERVQSDAAILRWTDWANLYSQLAQGRKAA